jgi:hypothetical protein
MPTSANRKESCCFGLYLSGLCINWPRLECFMFWYPSRFKNYIMMTVNDCQLIRFRSMTSVFVCLDLVALGPNAFLFYQYQHPDKQDDSQKCSTTAATFSLQHIMFQTRFLPNDFAYRACHGQVLRVPLARIVQNVSIGKTMGNYPSKVFRRKRILF